MRRKRIVLIEDEVDILDILKEALSDLGHENVVCFTNWDQYSPLAGDIVIHDNGVVGKKKDLIGRCSFLFSGDSTLKPDIPKPWNDGHLISVLKRAALILGCPEPTYKPFEP